MSTARRYLRSQFFPDSLADGFEVSELHRVGVQGFKASRFDISAAHFGLTSEDDT
jgi:hypothetical protein